jgi:mono/diheme cytochrome c family protein
MASARTLAGLRVLLLVVIVAGAACTLTGGRATGAGSSLAASAKTVSFKRDIQPIFASHCSACHIALRFGGLSLASYAGLLKGGAIVKGPVIIARNHRKSALWRITSISGPWPGGFRMPLGGPYLTTREEETIAAWIDQGARDN